MSPDPIAPVSPYFDGEQRMFLLLGDLFGQLGDAIQEREYLYHRGTFYADAAMAIEFLVENEVEPFSQSEYNWSWFAVELRKRAEELGSDAQFAMHLPPPIEDGAAGYQRYTNATDKLVSLLSSVYNQEQIDKDESDLGAITPAECAKILHRFVHYWLAKRCGTYERGYIKPWPWIAKVASELQYLYRQMGEADRAGSSGTPGGDIPPISWPGSK